jgi:DNA-binding NarL/FixJ family response regulator
MPLSVIVVDDDPAFRQVVRRILVAAGFVVVGEAATAREAVAATHELRPDAVLVDIGLPDQDGATLATTLVAMPWQPRVLLTSTDPDAIGADALRHSGAAGFLPKQELPEAPLTQLFMAG